MIQLLYQSLMAHFLQSRLLLIRTTPSNSQSLRVFSTFFGKNTPGATQKQLDKIQQKLADEQKTQLQFDALAKKNTSHQAYFNQNLFYGNQQNQFPKRQDGLREEIREDIEKQKKQVLSFEEYEKVQRNFKEKGIKRVPFFLTDDRAQQTQFMLMSLSRLLISLNVGYIGLSGYVYATAKFAMPDLLYFCTGGITVMDAIYHFYLRRFRSTSILRIEWDVESEQFAIVKPKGVLGETTRLIPIHELTFDGKRKDKDCIYFDAVTGEGLATVNRGQWYNLMLFMHIMQRNQKKVGEVISEGMEQTMNKPMFTEGMQAGKKEEERLF
ncbi:hypothetical protein FGO68_gene13593 [Halteria grandinella]|uniref:Transmembrane protein n=1 Tax=Halteria grandinella TaxID=5974 RepID=A0A8J8P5D2_HALGN|nr:hypothetical protein FGO68_gene13593 [Halteria grandinella]